MNPGLHCLGALALEVTADSPDGADRLERAVAAPLCEAMGADLRRLLPGAERLDLAVLAACFDPAQLLRPGWPVHAALAELLRHLPAGAAGRVLALGAHRGELPTPVLTPEHALGGGPLRLLPFVLAGPLQLIGEVGAQMEQVLIDRGMAAAATALLAQDAFGLRLEHVRYLSLHDLCALTAMQYRNVGLDGLWQLIETALLSPGREERLSGEDGDWLLHDAVAYCAVAHDARAAAQPGARQREQRRRQFESILHAHGIGTQRIAVGPLDDPQRALQARAAG